MSEPCDVIRVGSHTESERVKKDVSVRCLRRDGLILAQVTATSPRLKAQV